MIGGPPTRAPRPAVVALAAAALLAGGGGTAAAQDSTAALPPVQAPALPLAADTMAAEPPDSTAARAPVADGAAPPRSRQESGRCASRGYRKAVRTGATVAFVGANAGLYEYFRRAWWSGERSDFTVNWESESYFRQADKLGHMYGGYFLTLGGRELLEAACYSERRAAVWGAVYAAAFQLQIEVWDGFQAKYGFSPPDLVANTAGAGLALSQSFFPKARALKPTFSYRRTPALRNVDRFPAGAPGYELRPTVDYSGQTYWLSTDVDALLPENAKRYWPGILRFSVGRSVTDWVDPVSGQFQTARQKLVLTLDIDPEKLPGNNPLWRTVKKQLSYYHFPAPALVLTPSTKLHKWYR
jgi:uncharacterized protein YfiM (DUF2279 family)